MEYVRHELSRGLGDWEQRLSTALVKSSPAQLVRTETPSETKPASADKSAAARRAATSPEQEI
jgi:hypothetical protein